ncbi:AAA family ATPase [uncultured Corynebacterium sp.]|uniref:AAA family ATPase n=1 Tax=uncultured Corynebacterium sp. TaxID=159447 RepID=UPI002595CF7E|nr:AAA family ATPase [uncultured Corynebacterium sp.]
MRVEPNIAESDAVTAASRPESDVKMAHEVAPIIAQMLDEGKSVIDPSARIWTSDTAEELRTRVEENPILGTDQGQWDKLDIQLTGAPREVILLAAEIALLREHPVRSALPSTWREHVERILAHLGSPVELTGLVSAALDRPSNVAGFKPGMGYNSALWKHIIWIATFIRRWGRLTASERNEIRTDPWRLQQEMLESGPDRSDIRNALQFLCSPETFEPISSAAMKRSIRDGLASRIGGPSGNNPMDIDRDLLAIRGVLAQEKAGPFHFWTPGIAELWQPDVPAPGAADPETDLPEPRPTHYWLYSPGPQDSEWTHFAKDNVMAIGWREVGDLAQYPNREAIREALSSKRTGPAAHSNDALALWQFQHEIKVGDVVYAKRGRREIVGRGVVVSEPRFEPERELFPHVISVEWSHQGQWPHPGDAATKTLTDITKYRDCVEQLEELVTGDHDVLPTPAPRVAPTYGKDEFLDEVFLTEASYDRLRSLLQRKKNVILAGPPGVGKTYAAKRLAYSIIGAKDPSRVQIVQFHQSYSYEDFMMGYRPTEAGGFTLAEGPFYRFCATAREDDESRPYFFIIDEINRGNISKILGELLMLIEADKRGQELRLLYKNELFSVPRNLFIIGMMNTADRSLAVLDYALRRRFGFFEMRPAFDSEGFKSWQDEAGSPALNQLVQTVSNLNMAISDDPTLGRGFEIGHSFLTAPRGNTIVDNAWLTSVVEDELVPLLDEYWFDEPTTVAEWSTKLRASLE